MQIGEATGNQFEGNTISGPTPTFAFSRAPANTIRDAELGKTIQITLDATSTATLLDSRNYVWMPSGSGLRTSASASGSSMMLTFAYTAGSVALTTLDLAVRPQQGSVSVATTAGGEVSR